MTNPVIDRAAIDAFIRDAQNGVARVPVAWLEALREMLPDGSLAKMLVSAIRSAKSKTHGTKRRESRRMAREFVAAVMAGGDPVALRKHLEPADESRGVEFSRALGEASVEAAIGIADMVAGPRLNDAEYQALSERVEEQVRRLNSIDTKRPGRPPKKSQSREQRQVEAFEEVLAALLRL